MSDKMTKQQQFLLELFEKQKQGVVILQKKPDEDVPYRELAEANHETVLYSNEAYKNIVGTEHDFESINISFLVKKATDNEEANGMHQEEVYSIKDLLQKP